MNFQRSIYAVCLLLALGCKEDEQEYYHFSKIFVKDLMQIVRYWYGIRSVSLDSTTGNILMENLEWSVDEPLTDLLKKIEAKGNYKADYFPQTQEVAIYEVF